MEIHTKRLIIRPFIDSDLKQFKKLLTIKEVEGWTKQQDRAKQFLNWHISNYATMDIINGIVCFGIFNQHTGDIVGATGAGKHDDLNETEVFYHLLPEYRGQGYATEAGRAVTEWALESYNLKKIIATIEVENESSKRVVERIGYRYKEKKELFIHIINTKKFFLYYEYEKGNTF